MPQGVGLCLPGSSCRQAKRKSIRLSHETINISVPYIRQAGDTDVQSDNGEVFDGRWACGATSAVMINAYHDRLNPHQITVYGLIQSCGKHISDFGWYVSQKYKLYGYTYDEKKMDANGNFAYGAYGYVHNATGYTIGVRARGYFRRHGLFSKLFSPNENLIKNELDNGNPVFASTSKLWKNSSESYVGHIVVIKGYSADGYYVSDPWPYSLKNKCSNGSNMFYNWNEMGLNWIVTADPINSGDRVKSLSNSLEVRKGPSLSYETNSLPRQTGDKGTLINDSLYNRPYQNSDNDTGGDYDHHTWWKIKWDDGVEGWSKAGEAGYKENLIAKIEADFDNTPPLAVLNNTLPLLTNTTIWNVTVGGSDIVAYKFQLDDQGYSDSSSVNSSINLDGLKDGEHILSVIGQDQAGNWQPQDNATTHTWTVDTTPPTTADDSGLPQDLSAAGSTTISVSGEDVVKYKYALDGGLYSDPIAATETTSIDLSSLGDGEHTISIMVCDQAGNWQGTDNVFTTSWSKDTTAPVITGLSNSTDPVQKISWSWSADENATFRHTINQNSTWIFENSASFNATTNATLKNVSGTWYLHVQAKDQADNLSPIQSVFAVLINLSTNQVEMAGGWNLEGMSKVPQNATIEALFSDIMDDVVSIWKWQNDTWSVFLPAMTEQEMQAYIDAKGFSKLVELGCGQGFWVNTKSNCTLQILGTEAIENQNYYPGWNLLSLTDDSAKKVSEVLINIPLSVVSLWKWKDSNWKVCLPEQNDNGTAYAKSKGFGVLEEIEPGDGFWVNCQ